MTCKPFAGKMKSLFVEPVVRYILEPCGHRVVCGDCAAGVSVLQPADLIAWNNNVWFSE